MNEKTKKIWILLGVLAVAYFVIKRQGGTTTTTETSAAEGWAGAANSLTTTANDAAQKAINTATDQIGKIGNWAADWADRNSQRKQQRINNAYSNFLY